MHVIFWGALLLLTISAILPGAYLPSIAIDIWDKAQHAAAYALLTIIGFSVYVERKPALLVGLLLHGAAIELIQALLSWRHGDWLDWIADGFGILIGSILVVIFTRWKTYSKWTKD